MRIPVFPSARSRSRRAVLAALACLALAPSAPLAVDQVDASYAPPGGLPIEEVPLFVVLGFDDNRYIDGMQWVLEVLEGKRNPAGKGNPSTYDGQPIKAAFYYTSSATMPDATKPADVAYKADLLKLWKRAVANGHEVANHTHTHNTGESHTKDQWVQEIRDCTTHLTELLGIDASEIWGFRTPYLAYNKATFDALKEVGLLYEATVTHQGDWNKRQHVWPYTLHNDLHQASTHVSLSGTYPGLWEIPVYTTSDNTNGHPAYTGFDSSILTQSNGASFGLMLINGLDYRLAATGNRAPYTVGLHSDTYSNENESAKIHYDPRLKLEDRKKALSNFIDYALTKPNVRFVTAKQLIQWMRKPVALSAVTPLSTEPTKARAVASDLIRLKAGRVHFQFPREGRYRVSVLTLDGRIAYRSAPIASGPGGDYATVALGTLPKGTVVMKLEEIGAGGLSLSRRMVVP